MKKYLLMFGLVFISLNSELVPRFAPKAIVKLWEITDCNDGYASKAQKALKDMSEHIVTIGPLKEKYEKQTGLNDLEFSDVFSNGSLTDSHNN